MHRLIHIRMWRGCRRRGQLDGYGDDRVNEALAKTQTTSDMDEIKGLYSVVDQKVQEDVPMFSAYIVSAQAAVNKRLSNATPSVYGFFNNVEQWEITK